MGAPRVLISDGGWATWQHTVACGQAANIGKRWTLGSNEDARSFEERKERKRGREEKRRHEEKRT